MKPLFLLLLLSIGIVRAQFYYDVTNSDYVEMHWKGDLSGIPLYGMRDSTSYGDSYFKIYCDTTYLVACDSNNVSGSPKDFFVMANKSGQIFSYPANIYDTGNTTLASTLLQTAFVVTHGLGYTPASVAVQPRSSSAAGAHYVSSITSTTFTITYQLNIGVSNLTWDWVAYR